MLGLSLVARRTAPARIHRFRLVYLNAAVATEITEDTEIEQKNLHELPDIEDQALRGWALREVLGLSLGSLCTLWLDFNTRFGTTIDIHEPAVL